VGCPSQGIYVYIYESRNTALHCPWRLAKTRYCLGVVPQHKLIHVSHFSLISAEQRGESHVICDLSGVREHCPVAKWAWAVSLNVTVHGAFRPSRSKRDACTDANKQSDMMPWPDREILFRPAPPRISRRFDAIHPK
jgi:hypothetical protein